MILRFTYQPEPLRTPPPPSLPPSTTKRWRPLVPITIHGAAGRSFQFGRALADPGADDTIFPYDLVAHLGVVLHSPTGHAMRWRGRRYALEYGDVELELTDVTRASLRWPATIAFTRAPIRYPFLGICGCLEQLDVRFLGDAHLIEFEPNAAFQGTQHS